MQETSKLRRVDGRSEEEIGEGVGVIRIHYIHV